MEALGFNGKTKSLTINGKKDEEEEEEAEDDAEVDKEEATNFRAIAARLNFMAIDCPDVTYPVKELRREMSSPKESSWRKLKRLARFVLGRKALVWRYEWQPEADNLDVYSDSDWAGCIRTRISTSGGAVMYGKHLWKAWSSTQGGGARLEQRGGGVLCDGGCCY